MLNRIPWSERAILIIDDDELSRSLMAEVLSGCRILQAANGNEALELMNRGARPDLVISDYHMPGLTGVETLQQIRKRFPSIRCVLMSGSEVHEIIELAIDAGAHAWLKKPFADIDLFEQIKNLLQSPIESFSSPENLLLLRSQH